MKRSIKQLLLTLLFVCGTFFFANTTPAYAGFPDHPGCVATTVWVTLNTDSEATIDDINETYGTTTLQTPLDGSEDGPYLLLLVGSEQSPMVIVWTMNNDDRIEKAQASCNSGDNNTEGSPGYGW